MAALERGRAEYITIGEVVLPLIVKKHPTARSIVVRYDASTGSVRVTSPRYVSIKKASEFAHLRIGWIEKQMEKIQRVLLEDGSIIPLWGKEVRLVHIGGRGITQQVEDALHITGDIGSFRRRLKDHITKEMKRRTAERAQYYAEKLGVKAGNIRIMDMRSRWGSCTSKGDLSFALRLAFAPMEVLDYVVCHEVCHIKHLNHSARFWQLVESLCPAYEQHEAWLTRHGHSLWNYG